MESTVKERLVRFIKHSGLSVNAFEKKCGFSTGFVGNMRKSMQPDKIQTISKLFPTLNTNWLLTGEGEMLNSGVNNQVNIKGNDNVSNIGQHISISLPENGTQKIINPDGTVKVQPVDKDVTDNSDKFIELLKKKDEQIDRLLTLLENK